MEVVGTWDWILRTLSDGNPAEAKRIEERCSYTEIATSFALQQYVESAELKDSAT